MNDVKSDELITDPTATPVPDLRFTLTEWVLYWRTKYEGALVRVREAADQIETLQARLRRLEGERRAPVLSQAEREALVPPPKARRRR